MTIDPNKLAGIPKMATGQAISAAAELDKLCTPVAPTAPTPLFVTPVSPVVFTPPVRVVQPDPAFYWADDYGNIWRQAVEPVVVLTVTSGCTISELGIILAALLGSR